MNLARLFKAGKGRVRKLSVALATLESPRYSAVADATQNLGVEIFPAFKRRAKFIRRYASIPNEPVPKRPNLTHSLFEAYKHE